MRIKTAALKDRCAERVKTKWIRRFILVLIPCSLLLTPGCKTNDWTEWKVQNELWLKNNALQDSVVVTSSGLQYKIIADPEAELGVNHPNTTSTIVCDYRLRLINGNILEVANGASFSLANTIPGFSEGCRKLHGIGDIELYIPAYLGYDYSKYESNEYEKAEGYGTEGTTGYIPPYSTLIYEVHICAVTQ